MATFEATQNMRVQRHFEVFEIDLPVITSACTIGSSPGFGTPLTCDQTWTGEYKTYYLTNVNAPVLPSVNGEPIFRCILNIRETSHELKPGDGLASRSSLSITLVDFTGQDPNITAPGVTEAVKNQGTFLGKLDERQIFENKDARLKLYRIEADGSIDLVDGAQTRYFLANTIRLNTNTRNWTIECKDVLSLANLSEKTWPITQGGFVRQDVNDSVVAIPVDGVVDYSTVFAVRIGDEFLEILSVTNNLTPTAVLNVDTRGSSLFGPVSTILLTETEESSHTAGDEVFVCHLSDDETIDSLYTQILTDSDLDISLIPAAEWAAEVDKWHENDKINTLHSEAEDVNTVIRRLLTAYLMDSWFSTTENLVRLSAISVHKQSSATLTEGKEINAYTINKVPKEEIRASKAIVVYDKRNLADSDKIPSYKKASQFADNTLISPALFSKHKDKLFDNNFLLDKDAADLLTQRYVSRFKFTPYIRTFKTEERALTFKTGDVVDLNTTADQSASGLPSGNIRGQVIKINPRYEKTGRIYDVTTMTYEAAFNAGSEIVLDSPLGEINFYILAGAPSQPIELTFILDGTYSQGETAMRGGNFAIGSKLILIMVGAFDGQANGGFGGKGQSIIKEEFTPLFVTAPAQDGGNGGIVYDANGVDTDIYFSGATPSAAFPVADGFIRAPSGGDGGFDHTESLPLFISGKGGNGGDGRSAGVGGDPGDNSGPFAESGIPGVNGEIDGLGTGWGVDGIDNDASKGLKGSGIIDSGATVTLFGDTPARYINGAGDHP